ncbi:GGDEF domain-containing protein [Clostridium estertheticum]|uniref:GGDEF domain-containing protein n=1 Tax=Clostridium estertheticum TaxID=238834 RepID=UPI0013E99C85|nr:GGDEF domain-containing protein [Clostridium estertheticum]MBZ9689260.1 GGDEF domain-containing protein [Clostridium estertheticum]
MEIIEIIKEKLSIFKNLYDTVRIIDPINKKVMKFEEDETEVVEESCFRFWKTEGYCKNCISMRAYLENDTFIKMEVTGGKVFLVISSPVTIENKVYIVEILKDVTQTGSIINNEKSIINIESLIKEMNDAAIKDELTGMYNRRYINERLQSDINDSVISNKPLCVVMADLDFFKDVNDNYGHVVGDSVLKDFAKILSTSVRSDSDWVGRYGGEEFLIVLRNTDGANAFKVIEKIRKFLQENIFDYKDIKIKITASFGGYSIISEKITIDELINEADKNLYLAKNSGRNKTIINL